MIKPEQRRLQRIFLRSNPNKHVTTELNTVTHGTKAASGRIFTFKICPYFEEGMFGGTNTFEKPSHTRFRIAEDEIE